MALDEADGAAAQGPDRHDQRRDSEDVNIWFSNAKALQDDVNRSKAMANDILKQAETPDVSGKTIREAEERADFLIRELNYNQQVRQALAGIKRVNQSLDQVEQASKERRILDALHLLESAKDSAPVFLRRRLTWLEESWTELDALPVGKSCRAVKLLDIRAFELKSDVHAVFDRVWNMLVNVDLENGRLSILETREGRLRGSWRLAFCIHAKLARLGESMSLSDAVIGLKAYKEVDERMLQLWHDLDTAILAPRTDIVKQSLPAVRVDDVRRALSEHFDTPLLTRLLFRAF